MTNNGRAVCKTTSFAFTVVRNPFQECPNFNKFLAIEETNGRGWWVPGGALNEGETFQNAALREVWEEAKIRVELKGILKMAQVIGREAGSPPLGEALMTVAFYAEPISLQMAQNLKKVADKESIQAEWFTVGQLR